MTERSQVRFQYSDGSDAAQYEIIESVGGGCALFDIDNDGDQDLYFAGGGTLNGDPVRVRGRRGALWRNDGEFRFTDVSSEWGLPEDVPFSHGCAAGDFDSDGFIDLFVAGYRSCRLYRNDSGRRFVDQTEQSGLRCPDWNVGGAWADFDGDGFLDLYVLTYGDWAPDSRRRCINDNFLRDVCPPVAYPGVSDRLFRNRGDGSFEDVSRRAGLVPGNRGLGVVAADFNGDGRIDYYVANDVEANQLYLGQPQLPFREDAVLFGCALSPDGLKQGSMGADAADFTGDGVIDLVYLNYADEDNSLLKNLGGNGFLDVTAEFGLQGKSRRWVGFGTALADFDNDGWPDFVVLNGHVAYGRKDGPYLQPAQLFRNQNGKRFEEVGDPAGPYFSVPHAGRGLAAGDLDDDGALDLVMVHQNEPVVLLRNRNVPDHWVCCLLRGTDSNRDAVGAALSLETGGRTLTRWILGGGSYLSHGDRRVLFPLDSGNPVSIAVRWPSGRSEVFPALAPGATHELVEGRGIVR